MNAIPPRHTWAGNPYDAPTRELSASDARDIALLRNQIAILSAARAANALLLERASHLQADGALSHASALLHEAISGAKASILDIKNQHEDA